MNSFMEHEKEIASLLSVSESRGGAHRSLYLSSALRLVCAKHRGSPHTKKAPVRGAFFVIKGGGQGWIRTTEVEDVRFTV